MATLETTEIAIGYPKNTDEIALELALGACKAVLQAGNPEHWADGTYEHPSNALPPTLEQNGGKIKLSQDYKKWGGFFNLAKPPSLNLTLNKSKPFALHLEGGATEAVYHLGGLPLTELIIQQGAGSFTFNFDSPNPQSMEKLEIGIGAAALVMNKLANANFRNMKVGGGAASFQLDFGGTLQQDAQVKIETGLASVEISIPSSTAAKVTAEVSLASVDISNEFTKKDGVFWSPAAIAGNSPLLTIHIEGGVGSVNVKLG